MSSMGVVNLAIIAHAIVTHTGERRTLFKSGVFQTHMSVLSIKLFSWVGTAFFRSIVQLVFKSRESSALLRGSRFPVSNTNFTVYDHRAPVNYDLMKIDQRS